MEIDNPFLLIVLGLLFAGLIPFAGPNSPSISSVSYKHGSAGAFGYYRYDLADDAVIIGDFTLRDVDGDGSVDAVLTRGPAEQQRVLWYRAGMRERVALTFGPEKTKGSRALSAVMAAEVTQAFRSIRSLVPEEVRQAFRSIRAFEGLAVHELKRLRAIEGK